MPRHTRNEIKAGLLIVAAIALLITAVWAIADFSTLLLPKKVLHFSFDNVEGLQEGDDVTYAGKRCGSVLNVKYIDKGEPEGVGESATRVLVTVEVRGDVPMRDKDRPVITKGFTGAVAVDIIPFRRLRAGEALGKPLETTPETPLVGFHYPSIGELAEKADKVIDTVDAELARVSTILKNVEGASADVKDITGEAKDMVNRNSRKVDGILDGAARVTKNVEDVTVEVKPELLAAVKDVRETVKTARERIDEAAPKIKTIMENVEVASGNVRAASADVKDTTGEAKDLVIGNRPNIDGAIEEMRQSAARLNLTMEDLRRNPWKLLNRNIEADPYTQNIYDAAMSFAEGARALSASSASLEAMMAQPDADPEALRASAAKINTLVDEMVKLEKLLYGAMKSRPK